MSDTMKALVYLGPGILEIEERRIPKPAAGEVQIRIHTVSICGSDLGAYQYASDRFRPPLVLGHEFSGDITALGEGTSKYRIGQKVTVNPMMICRECFFCRRGEGNLCKNRRSLGTAIGGIRTDGAMQEYVTVPEWMAVPVAENVSYEAAALLEPCGVTLACAKKGRTEDEKTVVVLGVGPIGLLTIKFLKALGVPTVIAVDKVPKRLEKAMECGAKVCIHSEVQDAAAKIKELTGGCGADRVINTAGEALINVSFEMVRNGGTCVLVALTHSKVQIDPMEIVGRGLNFVGSYMFTTEMEEAAGLLADGRISVEDLITSTVPLSEGKTAFDRLCRPQNEEIKVQIRVRNP